MTIISVNSVSVAYRHYESSSKSIKTNLLKGNKRKSSEKMALKNIGFHVNKGEIIGVIGRNGAGKSTLAKLLMGIVKPTSGRVLIDGELTGLLSLGAGLNMDRTAKENITFVHLLKTGNYKNLDEIVEDVSIWTNLGEALDQPLRTYSSGMLARLSFALETAYTPDVLIIDEVLSVGDFEFTKKSTLRMNKLLDSGATVILISHDLHTIETVCSRTIWLEAGKLIDFDYSPVVVKKYINS